jgi:hypothetical protein
MKTKTPLMLAVSAFAIACGSFVVAPTASADGCITITATGYTVTCTNNGGSSSSYTAPPVTGPQNSVGSVDGIMCTTANAHRCRAHLQNGGTYVP